MNYYELSFDKSYNFVVWEATKREYLTHFHRNIEIIYVISGELIATVNDVEYYVRQDEMLFVSPFAKHSYTTPHKSRSITTLIPHNHISDFYDLFKKNKLLPYLNDKVYNRSVLAILQEIKMNKNPDNLNEVTHRYANRYEEKGWVNIIIGKLIARYPLVPYNRTQDESLIISVLSFINDNFAKNLTLDSIADSFGYNKYYVSKLFHKYVGVNFRSYLNLVRIQNIQSQHLSNPETNMTQLILDNGYASLSTYYRALKSINEKK